MAEQRSDYPDILEKLGKHSEVLARIDERQQFACERLDKINGSIETLWGEISTTKKRVGKLEQWRSFITGGIATITAAFGAYLKWGR